MIVDTSAFIEFLRATGSATHRRLSQALRGGEPLYVTAVVLQEVLQGARSPTDYVRLQHQLAELPLFEPDSYADLHNQAAMIYARCRWQGFTPRSANDCVIAASALEADMPLLARDADFAHIRQVLPQLRLA